MSYAAINDLIERFSLDEVKQLAPLKPPVEPFYDAVRLDQVLADASAELDSHLAVRFAVPISPTPDLLVKFTCDLAREALDRTGRANLIEAGKRARAWARDVAQGRATLGAGADGDAETLPEPTGGAAAVSAPDRVFDEAGLRGYLR